MGNLYQGSVALGASGGGGVGSLEELGVVASATELNYVDGVTSNIQSQLDNKVGSLEELGVVATATELNYVDGVTSNIQTQLNNKVGSLEDLGVTATTDELNYVDGVTSNIQSQLDNKAGSSHNHSASEITSGTLSTSILPTVTVAKGGTGFDSIADTIYTDARYRASSLHSAEPTPTINGVICWMYE